MGAESSLRRVARAAATIASSARDSRVDVRLLRSGLLDRGDEPRPEVISRVVDAYSAAVVDRASADEPYRLGWQYADADASFIDPAYLRALNDRDATALRGRLAGLWRRMPVEGLLEYARFEDIADATPLAVAERFKRLVRRQRFIASVLDDVDTWAASVGRSRLAELAPPAVGNPWGCLVDGTLVTGSAPRHHHAANEVSQLVAGSPRPRVAEIGGGFGGFAYYLLAHCSPTATYLDFDLPEVVALASYYLLSAFPDRRAVLYGEAPLTEEVLRSSDLVLMPNFALGSLPPASVDIVVNTASLSEMQRLTVERYIEDVGRVARRFFLHENSDQAVAVGSTHEIPASEFTIPEGFVVTRNRPSRWRSGGRGREFLLERDPLQGTRASR